MDETYKIIRFYFSGSNKVIKRGLTFEDAKDHCNDIETSSNTCSIETKIKYPGIWFDGYEKE